MSRRRERVPVMGASGQSDAERRRLRCEQRSLQKDIKNSDLGDAIENPDSDAFQAVRGKNNDLFSKVRYTREGVLDGENLDLISSRAARQVDKLIQVPRYDASRLTRKLREKCSTEGGRFNWELLGREVGTCFNSVPSGISFLCGPVDSDYAPKERKKPTRRRKVEAENEDENAEEERPEEVRQMEKDADKLSAVEKHIRVIKKTLKKRCLEEGMKQMALLNNVDDHNLSERQRKKKQKVNETKQSEICAIKCLFNPDSFTQTVENVFHFSFLVKKGDAGIRVEKEEEDGAGPVIQVTTKKDGITPRQAIVALNMKEWKELVDKYGVVKSDVPNRTGSKFAAPRTAGRVSSTD